MQQMYKKTLKQYLTASIETKHIIKDALFNNKKNANLSPEITEMIQNGQICIEQNENWKFELKEALTKPPAYTFTSANINYLLLMLDAFTAEQKKEIALIITGQTNTSTSKLTKISRMILELIPEITDEEKMSIIMNLTNEIIDENRRYNIGNALREKFKNTDVEKEQSAEIILTAETMQPDLPGLSKHEIVTNLSIQEHKRGHHSSEIAVNISPMTMKMTEVVPNAKPIDIVTRITPEELTNITLGAPEGLMENKMTYYDRRVEDAIGNLFQDGFNTISADMVYRQMNGLPSNKDVSEASCKKINDSISKLQVTYVKINVPDQKSRDYPQIQRLKWAGFDTPMESAEFEMKNGQTQIAYQIYNLPMIYKYSQMTDFSAKVPKVILNTEGIRNSDEVNNIRYCLIQIIEQIKRNIHRNEIMFEEIFKITGDETACNPEHKGVVARTKRIENIQSLLDDFIKKGYIENYEDLLQNGRKTGEIIFLYKNQKLIK